MKREKWTIENIDTLRDLHQKGCSLKLMARHLGKTATGINKALTRFEIRHCSQRKVLKSKKAHRLPGPFHQQAQLKETWVTLEETLRWLAFYGTNVQVIRCPVTYRQFYTYGSARLTDAGVVMLFNRRRHELGLSTLLVKGVSWE